MKKQASTRAHRSFLRSKRIPGIFLVCLMILGLLGSVPDRRIGQTTDQEPAKANAGTLALSTEAEAAKSASIVSSGKELRGIWVSVFEFYKIGLSNKSESTFRKNARKYLQTAKKNKLNSIFFHVRAFDDCIWSSETFKVSKYIKAGKSVTGAKAFASWDEDPLEILCEECHNLGLEFHAWMNPYRVELHSYLDPGKASNRKRVLKAVDEVLCYDVDGIHFDDYAYNADSYMDTGNRSKKYKIHLSAAKRRHNVNLLVKAVYKKVHAENEAVFGISPQGNFTNAMESGMDITQWLKKTGFVDYVMPQLYWTNNYTSKGNVKLFSQYLANFTSRWKNKKVRLYAGLALYRAGSGDFGDKGWKMRTTNLAKQVKELRSKGIKGFVLFTGSNLYDGGAVKKELQNLKKLL